MDLDFEPISHHCLLKSLSQLGRELLVTRVVGEELRDSGLDLVGGRWNGGLHYLTILGFGLGLDLLDELVGHLLRIFQVQTIHLVQILNTQRHQALLLPVVRKSLLELAVGAVALQTHQARFEVVDREQVHVLGIEHFQCLLCRLIGLLELAEAIGW